MLSAAIKFSWMEYKA